VYKLAKELIPFPPDKNFPCPSFYFSPDTQPDSQTTNDRTTAAKRLFASCGLTCKPILGQDTLYPTKSKMVYVGMSENPDKRLNEHNAKKVKSTQKH
jgi:hypothetical protein